MRKVLLLLILATNLVSAQETGLNEIIDFNKMSLLRTDILSLQQSSHDPEGGNFDGYTGGNFPETYNGENVMLHAKGKGIINRIWITGYEMNDRIKIYFDGEVQASVNETIASFFSGTKAPYLSPLVVNDYISSGGFFCYMPFLFEESIIITTTGDRYYNINYQLYENNNNEISTWTGEEDLTTAYHIFNNKGSDPRTETNYSTQNSTFDLSAGATKSAINISTSNQNIGRLLLKVPDLIFSNISDTTITDDGKAHKGYSQFTLKVNPAATNIVLTRRMDFWVHNQKANVYIDGQLVGEWVTPKRDILYRWLDAEFTIPSEYILGKDQITVKIEFVSSQIDWNEFYYWIYCDDELTDELDVGKNSSEQAHNYTINKISWIGSQTAMYAPDELTEDEILIREKNSIVLNNVKLQVFYDGETTPSIDAPIGLFFGMGTIDAINFQSLPVGVDSATNQMYCYFPIPFESSFELKIANNSSYNLSGVEVITDYEELTTGISNLGYLKTQFIPSSTVVMDKDHVFLEETGFGKFVGLVLEVFEGEDNSWLEGDERFYIDGCRTPSIYGTGTEDYFNGGWYFSRGTFHMATHGYTAVSGFDRSLYRFHLSDPVYFTNKIKLGIEHGWINNIIADYQSLAFYYHQPDERFVLTDELILGNSQSEQEHSYSNSKNMTRTDKTYYFEGDEDKVSITESGYFTKGVSEFTVNINPGVQVKIKRMFDYAIKSQTADIYVDDVLVGNWYTNGSNNSKRWREEFFMIPAEFTSGKTEITIKIDAPLDEYRWTEFHYWIYSIDADYTSVKEFKENDLLIYPNPASSFIGIKNMSSKVKSIEFLDISGKTILQFLTPDLDQRFDISDLNEGLFFVKIKADDEIITEKFIKK